MVKIPVAMPRYVVARQRNGVWVFHFQIPARLRPEGWSGALRLKDEMGQPITDPVKAVERGNQLNLQLDAERSKTNPGPAEGTMPWLVREYQRSEKFRKKADKTRYEYDRLAVKLVDWSKEKGHPQIRLIGVPQVLKFLSAYEDRPTYRDRLAALGSILWGFARRRGLVTENVWSNLDLEREAPDVHIWTDAEISAIAATADGLRRSSIATAVLLASESGQRQADVLDMRRGREWDGRVLRRVQNKTGAYITVPATQRLLGRLDALPETNILLVVNERTGKQWKGQAFSKAFREIAIAAKLPHLEFRSLRATCVCRLAEAGCTVPEIASITGHTLVSVHHILKHYWRPDSQQATNAIAKVEELRRRTGGEQGV